ncbi:hypothetical protein BDV59DRAFT_90365 [Aspergillus ambiguus]|uniref:uncharacterized protein n=1 Tax=Aspergillus ambiguus TaxID=176160 RepID=UPI003CCD9A90
MPPSPLAVTLVQSTILNAVSNVLAQIIDRHREHKPFTLNTLALLQFVTYAIIIVPVNFAWQKYVETTFPGFPTWRNRSSSGGGGGGSAAVSPDGLLPRKEKPALLRPRRRPSGLRNFAVKFFLDQTVGSVMNIVLFVVLINLLKGMNWARVYSLVCEDFGPIMIARLKYRPVVSVLMYTVVPVDRRVVFGSACGVIWGVYLSLYAAV